MFGRRKSPSWFFESETQLEAISRLVYLTETGTNLAWLTGATGSGRTTVLEQLRREFEVSRMSSVLLNAAGLDGDALLWNLASGLAAHSTGASHRHELQQAVRDQLLGKAFCQQRQAVLIDDAQLAAHDISGFLAWLSAVAEQSSGHLAVIGSSTPAGKPAFIREQPLLRIQLHPLSSSESIRFVTRQMHAWTQGTFTLEPNAAETIATLCGGSPAKLVRMCGLLRAVNQVQPGLPINRETVESVAEELTFRRAA